MSTAPAGFVTAGVRCAAATATVCGIGIGVTRVDSTSDTATTAVAVPNATNARVGRSAPCRIGCSSNQYDASASSTLTATRSPSSGQPEMPVRAGVSTRYTGQWKR